MDTSAQSNTVGPGDILEGPDGRVYNCVRPSGTGDLIAVSVSADMNIRVHNLSGMSSSEILRDYRKIS